jgi:hypothetical protein
VGSIVDVVVLNRFSDLIFARIWYCNNKGGLGFSFATSNEVLIPLASPLSVMQGVILR